MRFAIFPSRITAFFLTQIRRSVDALLLSARYCLRRHDHRLSAKHHTRADSVSLRDRGASFVEDDGGGHSDRALGSVS